MRGEASRWRAWRWRGEEQLQRIAHPLVVSIIIEVSEEQLRVTPLAHCHTHSLGVVLHILALEAEECAERVELEALKPIQSQGLA